MNGSIGRFLRRAVSAVLGALTAGALTVTVALFVMSSLGIELTGEPESAVSANVPDHDYENDPYYTNELGIALSDGGYYYDQLEEPLQRQYDYIVHELLREASADTTRPDGGDGVNVSLHGYAHTDESIERLVLAVYYDHPELYFLRSGYSYGTFGKTATVGLSFCMTLDERLAAKDALDAVFRELDAACEATTPYELERYYHDALVTRCTYDDEAANEDAQSERFADSSNPYAALCEGRAICGGYARAMHWLLVRVGVKATVVANGDHAWNMVWLNGEPYHLDPTWNDADDAVLTHRYFNVTDDDLSAGRVLPEGTVPFPKATATAANFYHREDLFVTSLDDGTLAAILRSEIEAGKTAVEIRFAPSVFEEAVAHVENGAVFADFGFLDEAAEVETWSRIAYLTDDDVHTLVLTPENT